MLIVLKDESNGDRRRLPGDKCEIFFLVRFLVSVVLILAMVAKRI